MERMEIDPAKQYVIVCPDRTKALELQEKWVAFLRGGVRAIFLYDDVAVVPVEQVVGWTTWDGLMKITDAPCQCICGWSGKVEECEPDIDGDGNLGCPNCLLVVSVVI